MTILFEPHRRDAQQYAVLLGDPSKKHTITRTRTDDFYNNPGSLMSASGPHGWDVVRTSAEGSAGYRRCQCHSGRCPGAWLLASLSFVDNMPSAGPWARGTGRRGLIGAWHRPH